MTLIIINENAGPHGKTKSLEHVGLGGFFGMSLDT